MAWPSWRRPMPLCGPCGCKNCNQRPGPNGYRSAVSVEYPGSRFSPLPALHLSPAATAQTCNGGFSLFLLEIPPMRPANGPLYRLHIGQLPGAGLRTPGAHHGSSLLTFFVIHGIEGTSRRTTTSKLPTGYTPRFLRYCGRLGGSNLRRSENSSGVTFSFITPPPCSLRRRRSGERDPGPRPEHLHNQAHRLL